MRHYPTVRFNNGEARKHIGGLSSVGRGNQKANVCESVWLCVCVCLEMERRIHRKGVHR